MSKKKSKKAEECKVVSIRDMKTSLWVRFRKLCLVKNKTAVELIDELVNKEEKNVYTSLSNE